MMSTADQLSNATKASLDAQLAAMSEIAAKALHSVGELTELNIATTKADLEHAFAAAQQILAAKDAQEVFQLSAAYAQPNADKALGYSRHLASIASKAQAELAKVIEARVAETSRHVTQLIGELSKAAPPGSEKMITMLIGSVASAHAAFEQLIKASKNAIASLEENFNEATRHFAPSYEKTTRSRKQ